MGGIYTAGETVCEKCGLPFRQGDKVISTSEAIYNEREEVLDHEPYTEHLYHKTCFEDIFVETVYRLVKDDILEVARAQDVELTEDEMLGVKKGIESGFGHCWWDIVESAIDGILYERKQASGKSETGD